MDIELNPEFSVLMEYNAALNENNMTTETLAISRGGYLNAALRWTFVEHLHLTNQLIHGICRLLLKWMVCLMKHGHIINHLIHGGCHL